MKTAKEFIYSRSQELAEAIDNGYDLRFPEEEILYWMGKYAEYCLTNLAEWLEEQGYLTPDMKRQEYLKYGQPV